MNILLASSAGVFDNRFLETTKNNSGFGHMVKAIANMLTYNGNSVDIITQSNMTSGQRIDSSRLYKKTYLDLLLHFKLFYISKCLRHVLKSKEPLKAKLKIILYYMTGSYVESIILKEHYDVVHINGVGMRAIPYIFACARTNTPFAITLHGLISFDDTVVIDQYSKNMEKAMLYELCVNQKMIISVVSTGIKKRIESFLEMGDMDNIVVICNPIIPFES